MRKEIGPNILAKIRSCVWNSLFKWAKFYPIPNHADKLVRLCLYNCNFCQPGIDGDFKCTKHCYAVQTEIIMLMEILWQQVVPRWHNIVQVKFLFHFSLHNSYSYHCLDWLSVKQRSANTGRTLKHAKICMMVSPQQWWKRRNELVCYKGDVNCSCG